MWRISLNMFRKWRPDRLLCRAYGEAIRRLDAAFTSAVRLGSRIDVYVNGNIATTFPIGSTNGDVLRDHPATITLHHVRPDANSDKTPFALFVSSRFEMLHFAQISRKLSKSLSRVRTH